MAVAIRSFAAKTAKSTDELAALRPNPLRYSTTCSTPQAAPSRSHVRSDIRTSLWFVGQWLLFREERPVGYEQAQHGEDDYTGARLTAGRGSSVRRSSVRRSNTMLVTRIQS